MPGTHEGAVDAMMTAVIPIGLTVLAVSVGVGYGRNFIKKIMKA